MPHFELSLTEFHFPDALPNNRANFRFVADLRYIDHRKQFKTAHAVMPSLDTFWECDQGRTDRPNFVRHESDARLEMDRIDAWERLIFLVSATSLHSIQFKILDVNRRDAWDSVKEFLGGILRGAVGGWKKGLPKQVSGLAAGALGEAGEDVQSFLLKSLAGGEKVLFRGATTVSAGGGAGGQEIRKFTVAGQGTDGQYKIAFTVAEPNS